MTDIEPWEDQPPTAYTPHIDLKAWAEEFRDVYTIAAALCKTPFVPREMLGHQADVAAAIMKGRELGLNPFDALGSIYIVHGRVGFYADFMRRRILQAGHIFKIIESTDTRCVVEGVRRDSGQSHRASFSTEQARKAGIDLGKYPADKLVARATSRLCKQAFPDVLAGTLIAEDLIDGVIPTDDNEAPPAATEPGPAIQRKRPTKTPKATRTQPKPATATEPDDDITELLNDNPHTTTPTGGTGGQPDTGSMTHPTPNIDTTITELLDDTDDIIDIIDQAGPRINAPDQHRDPAPDPQTLIDLTPDEPATTAQNRLMHSLFRQAQLTERQDRLTVTSHILGYDLSTSRTLTKTEAGQLIDTLQNWGADDTYLIGERLAEILNQAAIDQAEEDEDGDA